MKKIASVIALAALASQAHAGFVTNYNGGFSAHSLREPFTYTTTQGISTSGSYAITTDTTFNILNSGTLTMNLKETGVGGGYAYDAQFQNVTYNLGAATAVQETTSYGGTAGVWLVRYDFGYSKDNQVSWGTNKSQTLAAGKPTAVRDTNGSYLGEQNGNNPGGVGVGINGDIVKTGGTSSCVGGGCTLWSATSLGIEGFSFWTVVNSNAGFTVLDHWISVQDVIGSTQPFQITTVGSMNTPTGVVPVPAAAWLMGSGLVGLAGIARRRKMA
jgi:hypothetical protein